MDLTRITPEHGRQEQNTFSFKAVSETQLEGADVVLALSTRQEDMIRIPSAVLIASSDFFKTSLSGRWRSQDNCSSVRENGGQSPTTHRYGLTLDREAGVYTLIRGVSQYTPKLGSATNLHLDLA